MRKAGPPREVPPPLEMLCLKALWSMSEGTVNDVRGAVAAAKPLAYTTVMTVLERLARKNVISRRKAGRAFIYTPCISRDTMRRLALKEFVDGFFDSSERELAEFLQRPKPEEPLPAIDAPDGLDAALL